MKSQILLGSFSCSAHWTNNDDADDDDELSAVEEDTDLEGG